MTFLREHEAGDVLVHVARGVHRPPDLTALGPSELLYGEAGPTGPSGATMLSPDAGVTIRQLESQA
jgi:hypothetical protein